MLYVNGSFVSKALTGVQRYSYEMCMAMRRAKYEFLIIAPGEITIPAYEALNDHVRIVAPSRLGRRTKWDQVDLLRGLSLDSLLWNPSNLAVVSRVRQITTIHDLSVYHDSTWFDWRFVGLIKTMTPYTVRKSLRLLTDSETVKKEIVARFKVGESKVVVTYSAASSGFHIDFDETSQTKDVIVVGTLEPRKNLKRVLQAWCQIPGQVKRGSILRVVGQSLDNFGDVSHELKAFRERPDVQFMGRIGDAELLCLLSKSSFLVYMSLYEGFGLPVIEALSLNKACLISDIPLFRELFKTGCHFANPTDMNDIQSKMEGLLKTDAMKSPGNWANEYASLYNWDKCAQVLMRVADDLIG